MTNYEIIEKLKIMRAFCGGASQATANPVSNAFDDIAEMIRELINEMDFTHE